ncbi:hypothetical protein PMAYCL1PPCAC_04771 [Pristionchus mayeri]|uniref:C-type lectin n=1 Tax=Pristionchus mayeri TaxID=1317129 RepID=A0AAN4Z5S1_9BILA|nr:hypothetical protein PMAYCL1PPCAC_04771 [Pristionchus mayeri]
MIIVLGIVCNATSNEWIWADGSPVDYRPPGFSGHLNQPCTPNGEWYYNRRDANTIHEGYWYHYTGEATVNYDIHCVTELKKSLRFMRMTA